jgi:hypothetical protein
LVKRILPAHPRVGKGSAPKFLAGELAVVAKRLNDQYGWCVIPVSGKRALVKWKSFQDRQPAPDDLPMDGATGLAVLSGVASNGLVIRDFDDPAAYDAWASTRRGLKLPTVKKARGFHVYFRGPEGFAKYKDGEYRGTSGQYTLIPPSWHPEGGCYEWLRKPGKALPRVDDPLSVG